MKNILKICAFLFSVSIYSQGCSDAGFCVLQNTKEVDNFITNHHTIGTGIGFGTGQTEIRYFNQNIEYGYAFNQNFSVTSKLTYQGAKGNFGSNSEIGDLILAGFYRPSTVNAADIRFIVGTKIPLTNADAKNKQGVPLPMEYQSSMGTYDLILGTAMIYDKTWDISLAIQFPVINKTKNQFIPSFYNTTDKYFQTTGFVRKPDAIFKIGYILQIPESRFSFRPNLFYIHHFGKDTFTDSSNNKIGINESDGYTINFVLNTIVTFKNDSQLSLSIAAPSPIRTTLRPDGLVRMWGANLQYAVKF
jgi:hypothetical protein